MGKSYGKRLLIGGLAAILLLIGAATLAQADGIATCSASERVQILSTLQASGALASLQKITSEAPDLARLTNAQMAAVLQDANALQVLWHQVLLPALPDCDTTYQVDRSFGQWTDEITLTTGLFEAAFGYLGSDRTTAALMVNMAQEHTLRMAALMTDFSALVNELTQATPTATEGS